MTIDDEEKEEEERETLEAAHTERKLQGEGERQPSTQEITAFA